MCVCALHWFAEICTADVYVEVKKKKISVRVEARWGLWGQRQEGAVEEK